MVKNAVYANKHFNMFKNFHGYAYRETINCVQTQKINLSLPRIKKHDRTLRTEKAYDFLSLQKYMIFWCDESVVRQKKLRR